MATVSQAPRGTRQLNPLNREYSFFVNSGFTRAQLATCTADELGDGMHGAGKRQASRLLLAALRGGRAVAQAQEHAQAAVDAETAVEAVAYEGAELGDDDDAAPAPPGVEEQAQWCGSL